MSVAPDGSGFELSSVVYLLQPSGHTVQNLDELLARIKVTDPESIFLHTQMPRLRTHTDDGIPGDEISGWVRGVVQDAATAEKLAFSIQAADNEVESVREAIVKVLDAIPERTRVQHAAPPGGALVFMRFELVEVPTSLVAYTPDELLDCLASCDRMTWFHHLIEEAWLRAGPIPLVEWLRAKGALRLANTIEREVSSGRSVDEIRTRTLQRWRRSRIAVRVADAAREGTTDQASSQDAAEILARRLARKDPA
jgi:hypothetical protein